MTPACLHLASQQTELEYSGHSPSFIPDSHLSYCLSPSGCQHGPRHHESDICAINSWGGRLELCQIPTTTGAQQETSQMETVTRTVLLLIELEGQLVQPLTHLFQARKMTKTKQNPPGLLAKLA